MKSQNKEILTCFLKSISEDDFLNLCDIHNISLDNISNEDLDNFEKGNYLFILPQLENIHAEDNLTEDEFKYTYTDILSKESIEKTISEFQKERSKDIKEEVNKFFLKNVSPEIQEKIKNLKEKVKQAKVLREQVEKRMKRFEENPFDGFFELRDLSDVLTIETGYFLKKIFKEKIHSRGLNEKIFVVYIVNGEERWRPLDNYQVRTSFERMINGNYLFSVDNIESNLSDPEAEIYLSFFDAIGFRIVHDNYNGKRSSHHNQAFYPYRLVKKAKVLKKFTLKYALGCNLYSYKHKCPKTWVKECCLIWAIKQYFYKLNKSETLTQEQSILLNNISHDIDTNKHISTSGLKKIGETYRIKFIVHATEDRDKKTRTQNQFRNGFYGSDNPNYTIELGYAENHCFLFDEVPISQFCLKNLDEILAFGIAHNWSLEKCFAVVGKRKNGCWEIRPSRAHMNALTFLKRLQENNLVIPLMRNDDDVDKACVQEWIPLKGSLFEDSNGKTIEKPSITESNIKLIAPEDKKEIYKEPNQKLYFYADFETCSKEIEIDGSKYQQEIPFMVCVQSEDNSTKATFNGFDCAERLMDYLPNGAIVYFHNLGFDGRLLMKHGVASNIMKGSKIISQKHVWKGKKIAFKDSYSLFPQALRTFPESFKKEFKGLNIQKELFPYRYYTFQRLTTSIIGTISECGNDEQPNWNEAQRKQFKENIDKIPGCLIDSEHFDMLKYCEFYYQQDVNVLRIGFNAFRQAALNKPIEMDIFNLTTAPSLANEYLNKKVFFPNGSLFKYSGILQEYIM